MKQQGQALITLLFFTILSITIISTAAVVTIVNAQSTSIQSISSETYSLAEAGIENALLRLLRDPAYTGETMTIGTGSVTIDVTGTSPILVTAKASLRGFIRKVQVGVDYANNSLRVLSWKEVL